MHENGALVTRSASGNNGYEPHNSIKSYGTHRAGTSAGHSTGARARHRACHRRGGKLVARAVERADDDCSGDGDDVESLSS